MKRSLSRRIRVKLLYYINLTVGKLVDFLVRIGLFGSVPYERLGHYGDVIEVTHPYPVNYNPADQTKFVGWKSYKTFPHDLFLVKDVLLSADGAVLQKHRTFIPALPHPIFRYQYGVLYNLTVRLFYSRTKIPQEKKYLLVYDNWSWNNYFHWVIDALCRIQLVHEHVKESFTIVLPETSPKYLAESLALYGFTDVIRLPKKSIARIGQLYTMNYAAWSGQQHPAILQSMIRHVKSKIPAATGAQNRRVYVSRERAYSRKVSNEAEVVQLLRKYDFEILHFEGMSFHEQVALMQNVKYFVSSHGANMTNLIWLNSDAKILELIRKDGSPNFCYWSVASSAELRYYYQLCPITAADNVQVDIALLQKNIEMLLTE